MPLLAGLLIIILVIAAVVLVIAAILAVIGLILSVAGFLAAIAAGIGASAVTYFWYHAMAWCIRNRGGDRHPPAEGRHAYRQYLAGPIFSDFWFSIKQSFTAGNEWVRESVGKVAAEFAEGWMVIFAFGIYLGAFLGVLGGAVALAVISAIGSIVIGLIVVVALFTGLVLKVIERVRMRLAGAGYSCPDCHEDFRLPVYRCPSCGVEHPDLLPGSLGILKRRCACDQAELPTLRTSGRAQVPAQCPYCEASLHGSIGGLRNIRIPITGGTGAGKTTLCVGALGVLAQLEKEGKLRITLRSESASRFSDLVSGFDQAALPPPTERGAPGLLAEISPPKGRGGLLFAYDVAGELFNTLDELRGQAMFSGFEGAVMVIDPFSLDSLRTQFPREVGAAKDSANATETRPEDVYQRMVEALTELGAPISKLSLAIVVTKTDALPTDASLEVGGEVEDWLGEYGAGNLLLTATQDFGKVKCFASSALGGSPGDLNAFEPRGCLSPFAWIMGQKGVQIPIEADPGTGRVGGESLLEKEPEDLGSEFVVPARDRSSYVPTGGHLEIKGAIASFASIAVVVFGAGAVVSVAEKAFQAQGPPAEEQTKPSKSNAKKKGNKNAKQKGRKAEGRGKQKAKANKKKEGANKARQGKKGPGNR